MSSGASKSMRIMRVLVYGGVGVAITAILIIAIIAIMD